MKKLEKEVYIIFRDCLAKQKKPYEIKYKQKNVIANGKRNDYVFSKEKIEENKSKLIKIINDLGISDIKELYYDDMQYDKYDNKWTNLKQNVDMLVSLLDAANFIKCDNYSDDFDNPKLINMYEIIKCDIEDILDSDEKDLSTDIVDLFPYIDADGNVRYIEEATLIKKIADNKKEVMDILEKIKKNNPMNKEKNKVYKK